jgi:hypothetical protein
MQKLENNKSEKIVYSKKTKVVEKYGDYQPPGIKHNGCYTSAVPGAVDINVANVATKSLNPDIPDCVCDPDTTWKLVGNPNANLKVYGCQ